MTGIPCRHGCAFIKQLKEDIYSYMATWYKKIKQQNIYSHSVIPIETHDMPRLDGQELRILPEKDVFQLLPPLTKRPPGRPKTKRIESQFMTRRQVQCSKCHGIGHNRSSCQNPSPN